MEKTKNENKLYLNDNNRYCITERIELHSGDKVQISIDGSKWVETFIEYNNGRYYATVNPDISLDGLYCKIWS